MTPEVEEAVREIGAAFPGSRLEQVEDGQGGAIVTIHEVPIDGSRYSQSDTWVGFHITHTYPYADVYPHFVRHDLSRRDGKPLGDGTSIGSFQKPAGGTDLAPLQPPQCGDGYGASQALQGATMAQLPLERPWNLVLPHGLYARLHNHLFPGDGDEHGAVIAAGVAEADRGMRLLARDLHLAVDGVDYVPGKRGYRRLKAEFIADRIAACRRRGLSISRSITTAVRTASVFPATICDGSGAAIRRCWISTEACPWAGSCLPRTPWPGISGCRASAASILPPPLS